MIGIAPPAARFRIGISSFAHPELKVPMTPMTSLLFAYARALDVHFAESQLPAEAVESSQDWKPILYLPAFHPCWERMNCTEAAISVVSERFAPWSGRSDTM